MYVESGWLLERNGWRHYSHGWSYCTKGNAPGNVNPRTPWPGHGGTFDNYLRQILSNASLPKPVRSGSNAPIQVPRSFKSCTGCIKKRNHLRNWLCIPFKFLSVLKGIHIITSYLAAFFYTLCTLKTRKQLGSRRAQFGRLHYQWRWPSAWQS